MRGLEPPRINPYGPKPYAATSYATSTRWSKCDISHKDITETYPLSYHGILVYLSSANDCGSPRSDLNRRLRYYKYRTLPLSYTGNVTSILYIVYFVKRATRIELVISTWKDDVLPLHHARIKGVTSSQY